MSKRKLILFSPELPNCHCHDRIFKTQYETLTVSVEDEFLAKLSSEPADAAVICFCSARVEDVEHVLRFNALTGPIPVLTCTNTLNPEFIREATQGGVARFIVCDMDAEKIADIINSAIRDKELKEYFETLWPGSLQSSYYIRKLIDEIVHVFPHRMKVSEFAERLGIDRGWLHKLCKQAFGMPLTVILRHIWVYQALRMMQYTNLDNTEIALQLNYSEESSMSRDFRKELGLSPNEARQELTKNNTPKFLG